MSHFTKLVLFGLVCFVYASCIKRGGAVSSTSDEVVLITGVASLNRVKDADVKFSTLNSDGSKGQILANTKSDNEGKFEANVPKTDRPVIVTIENGSYNDEATGELKNLEKGEEYSAVIDSVNEARTVAVTPLTHIAAQASIEAIKNGTEVANAVKGANKDIAIAAGLEGEDLTKLIPPDPTNSVQVQNSSSKEQSYALVLAGLSQTAKNSGKNFSQKELISALVEDYSKDLKFDGKKSGESIQIGSTVLDSDAWSVGLSKGIDDWRKGSRNTGGITINIVVIVISNPTQFAAPKITSISPSSGNELGGYPVVITGTGFRTGITVTFDKTTCASVTLTSSTEVSCSIPAHVAGVIDVNVTNLDSQGDTKSGGFTHIAAPKVDSFTPTSGSVSGGELITVYGSGFLPGAIVKMGSTSCLTTTRVSSSELTCLTPAHTQGAFVVFVYNSDGQSARSNSGFTFIPLVSSTERWTAMTTTGAPRIREFHSAVWTGSKMLVWGGWASAAYYNTGGSYDPVVDTWTVISTTGAPQGRLYQSAIWTGSKMLIWGGNSNSFTNTGGQYDPVANTWTSTSIVNAAEPRELHSAVWTGSKMLVWGGFAGTFMNTGAVYDPALNTWQPITTTSAPTERAYNTGVWTGSKMVVWGGYDNSTFYNTGGVYDPDLDTWTSVTTTSAPTARFYHSAEWTGSKMLIWGGRGINYLNTGASYDPNNNSWQNMTTTGAPSPRYLQTSVWTGTDLLVFGGQTTTRFDSGGKYSPENNSWVSTTQSTAPSGRVNHSSVWTGTEMIVWGGRTNGDAVLNTGGRYEP